MNVSGQYHDPVALPQGKNPGPMEKEAGWAPEPIWTLWKGENPLALSKIESHI